MVIRAATNAHEPEPAQVGAGKRVTINYALRTNGVIRCIRSSVWGDEPLEYLHGAGRLLPALERALEGKAPGERILVTLPPEDAYGKRDRALRQWVPASVFGAARQIEPGMRLFARSEDGRHLENLMIVGVDEGQGTVLIDTNHPLAGMTLEFEISIMAVRDAGEGGIGPEMERKAS